MTPLENSNKMTHIIKGKKQSPEHLAKRIAAVRLAMQRPEIREKQKLAKLGDKNPMYGKTHRDDVKKKISEHHFTKRPEGIEQRRQLCLNNPNVGFKKGHKPLYSPKGIKRSEEFKKKDSESCKKFWHENPQRNWNYIRGQKGLVPKPQKRLFKIISSIFSPFPAIMEHPVLTKDSVRYIDVAIPILRLGFEYDEIKFHNNPEYEQQRDSELKEQGWHIIHFRH